jgi:hypothetical protein
LAVLGAAWGLTRGFWAVLRVWGEDLFPVSCADGRRLAWLAGGYDLGEVGDAAEAALDLTFRELKASSCFQETLNFVTRWVNLFRLIEAPHSR